MFVSICVKHTFTKGVFICTNTPLQSYKKLCKVSCNCKTSSRFNISSDEVVKYKGGRYISSRLKKYVNVNTRKTILVGLSTCKYNVTIKLNVKGFLITTIYRRVHDKQ